MKPRHAELLVQDLSESEVLRIVDRFLVYYIRTADRLTRTSVWLDEIGGIEHVRGVVLEDSLGIAAQLEAQMEDLVKGFQCEWKTALENPDILRRFKAFANDPRPNPAICFSTERGQRVPA
jgi:nitrite reductase (NADH) large subunit